MEACASPRDQALALVAFYAGARIAEIVGPDVDDVARSARKGVLRIYGKGRRCSAHRSGRTAAPSRSSRRSAISARPSSSS